MTVYTPPKILASYSADELAREAASAMARKAEEPSHGPAGVGARLRPGH